LLPAHAAHHARRSPTLSSFSFGASARPTAMTLSSLRLRDAEQFLWLSSIEQHSRSQLPLIALFLTLALQTFTRLAHLRLPAFVFLLSHVSTYYVKRRASERIQAATSDSEVRQHAHAAELLCIGLRIGAHALTIPMDIGDCIFIKMVAMVWMPIATAKSSCHLDTFKVFLVAQNILVLLRFSSDWEMGAPWIISTVIMDKYLLDWSGQETMARTWRDQLKFALSRLEVVAEETTKNLFHRFCDATANFRDDFELTEPAPRLGAMLNIHQTQGRCFTSLVDNSDLQRFLGHMDVVRQQSNEDTDEREFPDYIQINLMDSFAKPVPVHIFIACFSSMDGQKSHFIGISESWRPPKIKHKKVRSESGTAASLSFAELSPGSRDKELPGIGDVPSMVGDSLIPRSKMPAASKRRYSPRPGERAAASMPTLPNAIVD